jgi:hypothetical protein
MITTVSSTRFSTTLFFTRNSATNVRSTLEVSYVG